MPQKPTLYQRLNSQVIIWERQAREISKFTLPLTRNQGKKLAKALKSTTRLICFLEIKTAAHRRYYPLLKRACDARAVMESIPIWPSPEQEIERKNRKRVSAPREVLPQGLTRSNLQWGFRTVSAGLPGTRRR